MRIHPFPFPPNFPKHEPNLKMGLPMIISGCLASGIGFYEISSFNPGEGEVWGLVLFIIGSCLIVFGILVLVGFLSKSLK